MAKDTWQDKIMKFKAEKKEGDGVAATLVLLYLSNVKDYSYRMAKSFKEILKEENGWLAEILEYSEKLKDRNQLNVLLIKMEEEGFLISEQEEKGRKKKFYEINPYIFIPETNEVDRYWRYFGPESKSREYDQEKDFRAINELLEMLGKEDLKDYYGKWLDISSYDFVGFLKFIKKEAIKFELEDVRIIEEHIIVLENGSLWGII